MKRYIVLIVLLLLVLVGCSPTKPTVWPTPTTAAPTYGGYNYETCEANWIAGFVDSGLAQDGSRDLVVREWILSEDQIPETRGGIIQDCINGGWRSDYFETLLEAHPKPTPEWCNPIDGALYAEGVMTALQWLNVENEKVVNNLEFDILPRDPEIAIADEILKTINELDPPPCFEEIHTYQVEGVTLWRQSVLYLSVGEFDLATATANEATEIMILGSEKIQELMEREGLQ